MLIFTPKVINNKTHLFIIIIMLIMVIVIGNKIINYYKYHPAIKIYNNKAIMDINDYTLCGETEAKKVAVYLNNKKIC